MIDLVSVTQALLVAEHLSFSRAAQVRGGPRKLDRGLSLVRREKDGPDDGHTEAVWCGFQGEGCC